ncbi:MAG: D-alanyl-D-alanine carboxypeptidase [Clostridia bacterium]|nr:D-alanyl-D-alanine carboxypeptidase [Clostridia bacterium]
MDEALRRRYNERKQAIKKARRRRAIIRLVIRAAVVLLAIIILISVIVSSCGKKEVSDADLPQSEVEYTSSVEQQPEPTLPKVAADMETPSDVNSRFVAILSLEKNEIIASKSMHERIYPASLTKIMTLLVAFENNPDLDKTFTVTNAIIDPLYREEATLAGFLDGEAVTIRDLLYGTVLPSGAEAAESVAIATSGSIKDFLKLMNKKAKDMGLKNTHFANVTGLHDKQNYSTAYDMAAILSEALKHPLCREIMETYQYTTAPTDKHPSGVPLTSTIFSYMYGTEPEGSDILGGKTGYTDQAGYCIAAFGKADDGSEYICITAKGDSRWPAVYDQINLFSMYAK